MGHKHETRTALKLPSSVVNSTYIRTYLGLHVYLYDAYRLPGIPRDTPGKQQPHYPGVRRISAPRKFERRRTSTAIMSRHHEICTGVSHHYPTLMTLAAPPHNPVVLVYWAYAAYIINNLITRGARRRSLHRASSKERGTRMAIINHVSISYKKRTGASTAIELL